MASRSSVFKTLIYSDIFDFPLTKEEIWKFLIGKKIDKKTFEKELEATVLERNHKFYFLSQREEIVARRSKKKEISRQKIRIAKKIIEKLSIISTVLFIGISGGLALENSDEKDDIDLFVITSENTLWITRLLLVLLLIVMRQYRGRGKKESQKICLNMLISEKALMFEKDRRNLYTAHEIAQLKPIFNRNNMYKKFLNANQAWVSRFLPNAIDKVTNYKSGIKERKSPLFIFEKVAKFVQLIYMKKHRTREVVSDHLLAFHPFEYKNYVLEEYNRRLSKYEI